MPLSIASSGCLTRSSALYAEGPKFASVAEGFRTDRAAAPAGARRCSSSVWGCWFPAWRSKTMIGSFPILSVFGFCRVRWCGAITGLNGRMDRGGSAAGAPARAEVFTSHADRSAPLRR